MWETIYKDLVSQLGGPIGAFTWVSGWVMFAGSLRLSLFLYTEWQRERDRQTAVNDKIMLMAGEFSKTIQELTKQLDTMQERQTLQDTLNKVLTDFMSK